MGFLSRVENKVEDTFDAVGDKMFDSPISPVQIAKKAEKQMRREKMVGAGKQFAPTLYTILVNPDDDNRLFGYYPTLAGETETYLTACAAKDGLVMDGQPLVRFIVDDKLKHGKFDIIAECVAAPIVVQLRAEEMERYGLSAPQQNNQAMGGFDQFQSPADPVADAVAAEMDNLPSGYADYAQEEAPFEEAEPAPYGGTMVFDENRSTVQGYSNLSGFPRLVNMATHEEIPLSQSKMVIGRERTCDIVLDDINVSRSHAEFRIEPRNGFSITDLNSTNGTFVNGRRIKFQQLQESDRITLGVTNLLFTQR